MQLVCGLTHRHSWTTTFWGDLRRFGPSKLATHNIPLALFVEKNTTSPKHIKHSLQQITLSQFLIKGVSTAMGVHMEHQDHEQKQSKKLHVRILIFHCFISCLDTISHVLLIKEHQPSNTINHQTRRWTPRQQFLKSKFQLSFIQNSQKNGHQPGESFLPPLQGENHPFIQQLWLPNGISSLNPCGFGFCRHLV